MLCEINHIYIYLTTELYDELINLITYLIDNTYIVDVLNTRVEKYALTPKDCQKIPKDKYLIYSKLIVLHLVVWTVINISDIEAEDLMVNTGVVQSWISAITLGKNLILKKTSIDSDKISK